MFCFLPLGSADWSVSRTAKACVFIEGETEMDVIWSGTSSCVASEYSWRPLRLSSVM